MTPHPDATTPTPIPIRGGDAGTRTRAWRDGTLIAEDFPIADVSDHLDGGGDVVVWVDLCEPDRDTLVALADELHLHELAVEDALGPHQRPKLDHYDTHQFLSIHAVRLDPDRGELDETEIDAFLSTHWIITIRKNDRFAIDPVLQRWDRSANLMRHGVAFLLYGLLDHVVDQYFVAVDGFDDYYDTVSQALFDEQPLDPTEQKHWFTMRRSLVRFHRLTVSMREAVSAIMRREQNLAGELYPYYQDVYDHVLRISESSDSLRDLGSTIVETNLALREFRQNQVMKRVGSWAAIIAVPTLITGYYGMNVPYPGSGSTTGAIVSAALAVGVPSALYLYFRRREWL
jgi:magnesium transporter